MTTPIRITVFGASGKLGRFVVDDALAAGAHVTAYVRTPAKLSLTHERLTVMAGDATDPAGVDRAVAGADAVIAVLGRTKGAPPDLLERAGRSIVDAMKRHHVTRIVALTGGTTRAPGDPPDSPARKLAMGISRLFLGTLLRDTQRYADVLLTSGLEYVNVRPAGLVDGPKRGHVQTGVRSLTLSQKISRADAAAFIFEQAIEPTFAHQSPMIWW